jgi:lipoprotein signal peptidase
MPEGTEKAASPAGHVASFLRRHRLLAVLLLFDVATKLAAFHLLPEGRMVTLLPGLRVFLAVNEWGVMGGVEGIGAVTANPAYTLLLAIGLLLFALVIVQLGASGLSFAWRLAGGVLTFFAVAFAAETVAVPLSDLTLPAEWIVTTIRAAVLAVSVALYAASRAPLPRVAFTLLAAGAIANAASSLYPPFEVVDFLLVPLDPLHALVGSDAASSGAEVGVINLADVYLFAFPVVLLAWPAVAGVRRARSAALA